MNIITNIDLNSQIWHIALRPEISVQHSYELSLWVTGWPDWM